MSKTIFSDNRKRYAYNWCEKHESWQHDFDPCYECEREKENEE